MIATITQKPSATGAAAPKPAARPPNNPAPTVESLTTEMSQQTLTMLQISRVLENTRELRFLLEVATARMAELKKLRARK